MRKFLILLLFYRFRHETFVQFVTDIITILDTLGSGAVGVKTLADQLKSEQDEAVKHLDAVKKSSFTAKIEAQDRARDGTLHGLTMAVKSYLHHADAAKRDAATSLMIIIDNYKNLDRKTYDDESAAIADVLREFADPDVAPLVTLLGLGEWISQLSSDNARFLELMHARYSEAVKHHTSMKKYRAIVEETLQALLDRVEASATLFGLDSNPDLAAFVEEYNVVATRYKHILAQEKGRRAAAAGKGNDNDEFPDDEDFPDDDVPPVEEQ